MNTDQLTLHIKTLSEEKGFSEIGFTKAKYYKEDSNYLNIWLNKNYNASMKWIDDRKDERANIFKYYPEAKSVIVFGINYYTGYAKDDKNIGKISNYAWGDDYHLVIKERLYGILKSIKKCDSNLDGIVCVDTSPVMEKSWAQRAGIGWIGKHTNLLTRNYSSWMFLGVIIINAELKYDDPFEDDLCGSCTACIDECPTDALVEPYVLNSNKCISYITIENRGEIDKSIADKINNWIYGCDICQEVCPWSIKFSQETLEPSFTQRSILSEKTLDDWEAISEDDFKEIFKNSAIKRTKFSGFMRNIKFVKKRKST